MKCILLHILSLLVLLPCLAQGVTVQGEVINGVDGNGLPLCSVQLLSGGRSRARAVSDYAGRYTLPQVPPGSYDIVVVQFGDTLCNYHGLTVMRNTHVRHIVQPPTGDRPEPTLDYASGIRLLRPVNIRVRVVNMLEPMGLLITSPDDPRLWNFSGHMDDFEDADISFWYNKYKTFFKLKAMGYDITSPFQLIYPENHYPAPEGNEENEPEDNP